MISDTDSTDSEEGIRFKTTSTRNKDFRKRSPHGSRDRDRDRNRRFDKSRDEIGRSKNGSYTPSSTRDQRSPRSDPHRRKIIVSDELLTRVSSQSFSDDKEKSSKHKSKKSKHKKHKKEKLETKTKADSSSEDNSLKFNLNEATITATVTATNVIKETADVFGPSLPPSLCAAPPQVDIQDASSSSTPSTTTIITVPLQTEDLNYKEKRTFGPALPNKGLISPSLSTEDLSSDDEFDVIGPLPESSKQTKAHYELEKRALELKMSALNEDNSDVRPSTIREEWMLELPQINSVASLGLVARQFRTKERPDFKDRGGWTETPQDKEGKNEEDRTQENIQKALAEEIKVREISIRDAEQAEIAKKHKKKHKRDESLLEIHEKKLKKKKKKDEKTDKLTRRAFDRDIDLKVNRFDEAQKKSIVKKAQLLDTRFSSGAAKYL